MKILKTTLLLSGLLALPLTVFAHTDLRASNPGNGAVLNIAPASIELGFTEDVQLLDLNIVGASSGEVQTDFIPATKATSNFRIMLPALAEDFYKVSWRIVGKDAHEVAKDFTFTVDAKAQASSPTMPARHEEHSEHKH